MKHIYIIGGTMGIGKTTTCQILKFKLNHSVFLDGDWCWDMHPFQVTAETKQMVIENICFLLNSFIKCSAYQNIIFCWVMHEQKIVDAITSRLNMGDFKIHLISLVCSEQSLHTRLEHDIVSGVRSEDVIHRSLDRLSLYDNLDTRKVDVTEITPEQTADYIIQHC